jgi:hypothetical protein
VHIMVHGQTKQIRMCTGSSISQLRDNFIALPKDQTITGV